VSDVLLDSHLNDMYYITNIIEDDELYSPKFEKFGAKKQDYPNKHLSASCWNSILGDEYEKFFTFTFVRNPYARSLSLYLHHCRVFTGRWDLSAEDIYKNNKRLSINADMVDYLDENEPVQFSFEYFIKNFLCHPISLTQIEFLQGPTVSFMGRTESIDSHFKELAAKLGIESKELPKLNVGGTEAVHDMFYTPKLKDMVYERQREDFESLDYQR